MDTEFEFDDMMKERLLNLIEATSKGDRQVQLSSADAALLFHWKLHMNDPIYSFVPKKWRKGQCQGN